MEQTIDDKKLLKCKLNNIKKKIKNFKLRFNISNSKNCAFIYRNFFFSLMLRSILFLGIDWSQILEIFSRAFSFSSFFLTFWDTEVTIQIDWFLRWNNFCSLSVVYQKYCDYEVGARELVFLVHLMKTMRNWMRNVWKIGIFRIFQS